MTPEERQAEALERNRHSEMIWRGIYRKMGDAIEGWRTCSVRTCRRNKRCSSDSFVCIEKWCREDTRVLTPEEQSQSMHELRRMLDARMAELGEQQREAEAAGAVEPWRKRETGK